jgi:hypothetical protein
MEKSYEQFLKMRPATPEIKAVIDKVNDQLKKKNLSVESSGGSDFHPAKEYFRVWRIRMSSDNKLGNLHIGIPETVHSLGLLDADISLIYFNMKECLLTIFYQKSENVIVGLIFKCISKVDSCN